MPAPIVNLSNGTPVYGWGLQRKSRSGRVGIYPAASIEAENSSNGRRRGANHKQPHGAHGGRSRFGGLEKPSFVEFSLIAANMSERLQPIGWPSGKPMAGGDAKAST